MMGLFQGETVSFGHRQCYPGNLPLLDCSQQRCNYTTGPSAVLERLILAHHIFNGAAITDDDEMVCVYLLSLLLCYPGLPHVSGHDPLLYLTMLDSCSTACSRVLLTLRGSCAPA